MNAYDRMVREVAQEVEERKRRTPLAYELEGVAWDRVTRERDATKRREAESAALVCGLAIASKRDLTERDAAEMRRFLTEDLVASADAFAQAPARGWRR